MYNVEKWLNILQKPCCIHTAKIWKFVWPFFKIIYERVKTLLQSLEFVISRISSIPPSKLEKQAPEALYKKVVFKNLAKFTENTCNRVSFLIKLQAEVKKFCEVFMNTYSIDHLWTTASKVTDAVQIWCFLSLTLVRFGFFNLVFKKYRCSHHFPPNSQGFWK